MAGDRNRAKYKNKPWHDPPTGPIGTDERIEVWRKKARHHRVAAALTLGNTATAHAKVAAKYDTMARNGGADIIEMIRRHRVKNPI
jgi:hypothetical protein